MSYWILLAMAILFEVAGTSSMKFSNGMTRLLPSILVFVFYVCSLTSLTIALKRIEISTAYAIWSGVGTAMITVVGAFCFNEPVMRLKLASVALIVLGVIGLNLSGSSR